MLWACGVASCFSRGKGKADVVIDHSGWCCAFKSGLRWQPSHPSGFLGAPWWGYVCWEIASGLSSLQSYQTNISPCSGLCLQYSGAEQLAPDSIAYLSFHRQITRTDCLPESDGDRYLTAIGKWGTGYFPAFWGKKMPMLLREQCQQRHWQCASWGISGDVKPRQQSWRLEILLRITAFPCLSQLRRQ